MERSGGMKKIRWQHVLAFTIWLSALALISTTYYQHNVEDPKLDTVQDIIYFRDPRLPDDTCWATFSRQMGRGLARIPCRDIPPELIRVLQVNGDKGGEKK
jgi:hypothetical protein